MTMNEHDIADLRGTVERIHGCPASYRTSEQVRDQARQVEVAIFEILGHPRALLCYAWFDGGGQGERRAVTVLREGLVRTSLDAVRFALELGE